jgi:hypothetical protein
MPLRTFCLPVRHLRFKKLIVIFSFCLLLCLPVRLSVSEYYAGM